VATASEKETLLAQKENLPAGENGTALFKSPAVGSD